MEQRRRYEEAGSKGGKRRERKQLEEIREEEIN